MSILIIVVAVALGIAAILAYQGHQMYREHRDGCVSAMMKVLGELEGKE